MLDLCPILPGQTAADSFRQSLRLAQQAEKWGYHRYWVAEHHNIPGVASSATAVVISHLAAGTSTIRVGSGGIMLPNHAPLVIAEQFGTLESLHPGRIDLGLGRAPGGDQVTARALRRGLHSGGDTFPADLQELRTLLGPAVPGQHVQAIPGQALKIPIYLLGSSTFSATLAAKLGLPFAFASHFAPELLHQALEIYRTEFRPSATLERPHVMVGVNTFLADTDAEAQRLFTSLQQVFLNLIRGQPRQLPPPVETLAGRWTPAEAVHIDRMTRVSVVGSPATARTQFEHLLEATGANELITTAHIHDPEARLHSFELAAQVLQELTA